MKVIIEQSSSFKTSTAKIVATIDYGTELESLSSWKRAERLAADTKALSVALKGRKVDLITTRPA